MVHWAIKFGLIQEMTGDTQDAPSGLLGEG